MSPADSHSGPARAKVNLVLEVTGRRADGYHEIDTILQTLELADQVTLTFGASAGVSASGPYAAGTPTDESNLAWLAATELGRLCGESLDGLHVHLAKNIPAAGGLGGGASDAATTLRLLQRIWPHAREELLLEAAEAIGSDEAYFLTGGTARATGRGERVTPLPPLPPHDVALFVPPETLEQKTARLFRALDELPFDTGGAAATFATNRDPTVTTANVCNSFERVAFSLFQGLGDLAKQLGQRIPGGVRLAGAGPTLFWIGPAGQGAGVAAAAEGMPCTVILTRTSSE